MMGESQPCPIAFEPLHFSRMSHRSIFARPMSSNTLYRLLIALFVVGVIASCEDDSTPPNIVLNNPDLRIPLGGSYEEFGATIVDREDGVIDSSTLIIDSSAIRTDTVHTFIVRYYGEDAAGNEDSVNRMVRIFAPRESYIGSWTITEICDDTLQAPYTVEITAPAEDSTILEIANLQERGIDHVVRMTYFGRLGNKFTMADTLELYKYSGEGLLSFGTLDQGFEFELVYEETDTLVFFQSCSAIFSRP